MLLFIGTWAVWMAGPALAQESLDEGKSPAQLFASDCSICHKTTAGLSKGNGGPFGGLQSFLREHYTASREAAAAIAAYVEATDKGAPVSAKHKPPAGKRTAKGEDKLKKDETKKDEKKSETDKSDKNAGKKSPDKSGDAKSGETKPGDKASEDKKPADATAKTKPDKPKSTEAKDDQRETGDKPSDKSNKSD